MSRTKFSVLDVFATLLKPVSDAVFAETGVTFTRHQFRTVALLSLASALRTLAALLRLLASRIEPKTARETAPESAPAQTAPAPVVVAEPVATAPEVPESAPAQTASPPGA
jgi:hypothetical protein